MSKTMIGFFQAIGTLPKPWWAWVGLLMVVNLVAPILFIRTLEAKVVLVAFFLAAGMQMAIFRAKGFVRLLGIGHIIPWLPLLIWLGARLGEIGADTPLGLWILALIVLDGISLVIDFVDVGRYIQGERKPSFVLQDG